MDDSNWALKVISSSFFPVLIRIIFVYLKYFSIVIIIPLLTITLLKTIILLYIYSSTEILYKLSLTHFLHFVFMLKIILTCLIHCGRRYASDHHHSPPSESLLFLFFSLQSSTNMRPNAQGASLRYYVPLVPDGFVLTECLKNKKNHY